MAPFKRWSQATRASQAMKVSGALDRRVEFTAWWRTGPAEALVLSWACAYPKKGPLSRPRRRNFVFDVLCVAVKVTEEKRLLVARRRFARGRQHQDSAVDEEHRGGCLADREHELEHCFLLRLADSVWNHCSHAAAASAIPEGTARLCEVHLRSLPASGRSLVDGDATVFDADVAAGGEIAQHAVDHLARGADARRDVLLRELLGDHE